MTVCPGALLRTTEDLEAQLPGAQATDDDGDLLIRVPGGWRRPQAFVIFTSEETLMFFGTLVLTQASPLDAHLADPEGQQQ